MKRSQNDPYWEVVVEQYDNLLFLYQPFAAKRPAMLFDCFSVPIKKNRTRPAKRRAKT